LRVWLARCRASRRGCRGERDARRELLGSQEARAKVVEVDVRLPAELRLVEAWWCLGAHGLHGEERMSVFITRELGKAGKSTPCYRGKELFGH
jgi:hypothetical protein